MFQYLRWRLLLSYLTVMATILSLFGAGVYVFFSRSLYRELDKKLQTLAESAVPSLSEVKAKKEQYLKDVDRVSWGEILYRERQSVEWFDADGQPLVSKGTLNLALPPRPGFWTIERMQRPSQIRTFTIPVTGGDTEANSPSLEGYIRVSQSTEEIETIQSQLLWGMGMGAVTTLGLVGLAGFWLSQRAIEPVEQSFQRLKQFTADASHELRGPLTAIKASVDVMRNHPERIHPKDAKKLSAIASATSQMIELTEDLLFLARTDTPSSSLETGRSPIALNTILQELVDLFVPFAQEKGVQIDYQELAAVSIDGERSQLSRLFSNLLRNGIQYTPSGGRVMLRLTRNNRFAIIDVKDTGIGIAPEELPFVFDRFWRADKARSRREGGTGLGLSIAVAIAQRHGGKITVNSQLKVGSCFTVYLPLNAAATSSLPAGQRRELPLEGVRAQSMQTSK
ncbi:signal transduction histidine kinase [Pleurocapsa sp. PCC 7327]|uniref:sensor histidine kinase n=1 Tax=Pleurocapsa sp. PCC 7327 TaxID=118163 RepID=UPI00029FEEC4|nr:HAMP domain-containing sensor histidine kinase [Pleurocapsa sp. PCC 7327]AFY75797.1 signal transduction histidine kinase [Pleurocapsa sp. PCC 7327]